jgi:hypothetical protein
LEAEVRAASLLLYRSAELTHLCSGKLSHYLERRRSGFLLSSSDLEVSVVKQRPTTTRQRQHLAFKYRSGSEGGETGSNWQGMTSG